MAVELVGANPGLTLFDGGGVRTAYASAWRVDWSGYGRGTAVVLWLDERVRVLTQRPELGAWLAESFVRHFPEVAGLAWPDPVVEDVPVSFDLDLAVGVTVEAGDVELRIDGPLEHRLASTDRVELGGVARGFSTVFVPCRSGGLQVAGRVVPGAPRVDEGERTSSAFLADAEVWTDGSPA